MSESSTGQINARTEDFDFVAIANGHYSEPSIPYVPGLKDWKGKLSHSRFYRSAEAMRGEVRLCSDLARAPLLIVAREDRHGCRHISIRLRHCARARTDGRWRPRKWRHGGAESVPVDAHAFATRDGLHLA